MKTSRLTSKYQATIPAEVRERLGLRKGDRVAFEVENNRVVLRRVAPIDIEYAAAVAGTLNEWTSEEDEESYRDL
jgi:antitoxin PrlF